MLNFFGYMFLGSIIALIIGMFRPKTVIRWKKEALRKDVLKVYLSTLIVSTLAMGHFAPDVKNNPTKEEASKIIKDKQPIVVLDYEKDKKEALKLLDMSYNDLIKVEKDFSHFQKTMNDDIYKAISNATRNGKKVMRLADKPYPVDFEDSKIKNIAEKYKETLRDSNLFLQMAYNNFLDYVDNKKPTLVVKMEENIKYYHDLKKNAKSQSISLGNKYNIAYDDITESWREKRFIEEEKKDLLKNVKKIY